MLRWINSKMNQASKTILVSGASGLIGRSLCQSLLERGHTVKRLSRSKDADVHWDFDAGKLDAGALEGVDTVVHLAGEPVVQRWTAEAKKRILNSRVKGAELLVKAILEQDNPPDYISASGINYYGHQCGVGSTELSPKGSGFLSDVTEAWERAAQPLIDVSLRAVFVRIGLVLSSQGGALKRMLGPFKLGLGGPIGSGLQRMSWIALPDMVRILCHAIDDLSIKGPINAVSPYFETNADFVSKLGKLLGRPTILPIPKFMIGLLFGKMGSETLLADIGVMPQVLQEKGFEWKYEKVQSCLEACVKGEF